MTLVVGAISDREQNNIPLVTLNVLQVFDKQGIVSVIGPGVQLGIQLILRPVTFASATGTVTATDFQVKQNGNMRLAVQNSVFSVEI